MILKVDDYEGIKFPVSKRYYWKIEQKANICIVFCYENELTDPVYVSDQTFTCLCIRSNI